MPRRPWRGIFVWLTPHGLLRGAELSLAESITIQEQMHPGFRVDRESRTIFDVCLLGPESRNGYKYSAEVIAEAATSYNRKPVYLNHAPASGNRDVSGVAGKIANPRMKDGRLYGDIKAIGVNGDMLLDLAESDVDGIGMSHLTDATSVVRRDKTVVKIGKIKSVDLVDNPATTKTLKESTLELKEQLEPILTGKKNVLERIKAVYELAGVECKLEEQELPVVPPSLTIESVADLREIAKEKPSIKALIEQFDQLQKDKWVGEVIAEQKLPDTDATKKALARCADKELMLECGKVLKEAVDSIKDGTKQAGREIPKPKGGEFTVDQLVSAFKG